MLVDDTRIVLVLMHTRKINKDIFVKINALLMKIYAYYNINKNELHFDIGINGVVVVRKCNQLYEFHNH